MEYAAGDALASPIPTPIRRDASIGKDLANPTAMILSAAMMLEWLAQRKLQNELYISAEVIYRAVEEGFKSNRIKPCEFGGPHGLSEHTEEIVKIIDDL